MPKYKNAPNLLKGGVMKIFINDREVCECPIHPPVGGGINDHINRVLTETYKGWIKVKIKGEENANI